MNSVFARHPCPDPSPNCTPSNSLRNGELLTRDLVSMTSRNSRRLIAFRSLVAACCLSILFGCNAKDQSGSQTIPPISPTSDPDDFVHDVGTVIAGSEVNYEFQIVNTSNE